MAAVVLQRYCSTEMLTALDESCDPIDPFDSLQ
jgi:hypothetical protein